MAFSWSYYAQSDGTKTVHCGTYPGCEIGCCASEKNILHGVKRCWLTSGSSDVICSWSNPKHLIFGSREGHSWNFLVLMFSWTLITIFIAIWSWYLIALLCPLTRLPSEIPIRSWSWRTSWCTAWPSRSTTRSSRATSFFLSERPKFKGPERTWPSLLTRSVYR